MTNARPRALASPEARRAHRTLLGVVLLLAAAAVLTGFSAPPRAPDAPEPPPFVVTGLASWYGEEFRGRTTACGQTYDPGAISTAHRWLPCGTRLLVTSGSRSVEVTVTDRGPYVLDRVLDLSRAAFAHLAPPSRGVVPVRATVLSRG